MVANVAYMTKVYIHNYHHGVIVIKKNLSISAKMLKTKGLGKNKICILKVEMNADKNARTPSCKNTHTE